MNGQVDSYLSLLATSGATLKPLMAEVGKMIALSTKQRFATSISPDGTPWEPNTALTIARLQFIPACAGNATATTAWPCSPPSTAKCRPTALTGKAESSILALSPATLARLRQVHGEDLENWWRQQFGFGFESLTESEARYLIKRTDAQRVRAEVIARLGQGG